MNCLELILLNETKKKTDRCTRKITQLKDMNDLVSVFMQDIGFLSSY